MHKGFTTKRGGAANGLVRVFLHLAASALLILLITLAGFSQNGYDNRPIGKVEINFGENDTNAPLVEDFLLKARDELRTATLRMVRRAVETFLHGAAGRQDAAE